MCTPPDKPRDCKLNNRLKVSWISKKFFLRGGGGTDGCPPPLPCVIMFLHTHNIWSSILYVWIRCEPRSLQVTLSVCLFVAYFEQTTSCARSCMNELINYISWLFPSKMTPHKGLCAFLFIEYALCAWIMHYVVCIMHYASCIMHNALSNIHCVSWLIIKKSNGFFKIPLSSGNVTPCKSFFFINIFVYACMHGHFIMYACN